MSSVVDEVRVRFQRVEAELRSACAAAGRTRDEVTLVAVSKRQPEERLAAAIALGHRDFGENYPQEMRRKQQAHPELRWHMVGHLQRNKARLLAEVHLFHGLDSLRLAKAMARLGVETARPMRALVQVNQGREAAKTGFLEEELPSLFEALSDLKDGLDLQGFMTIPPPGEGPRHFERLRRLRDDWVERSGLALPELSMGMSDDFGEAIAAGATIVRVGTALFGQRPK
ncbi:MAG: YggS family pyridoxal phosphate-dependent enzyme [Myxococcota bacterium]